MYVRNYIWKEIQQAIINVKCARHYTSFQRCKRRYVEFFVAIVAAAGVFGYLYKPCIPFITSILIAVGSLVKIIYPQCLQPEKDLLELDMLIAFYEKYQTNLGCLLYELNKGIRQENDILEDFKQMKNEEAEKQVIYNKHYYGICKKTYKRFVREAIIDLEEIYKNNYEHLSNNER